MRAAFVSPIVVVVVVVLGSTACTPDRPKKMEPVKVGSMQSLSGALSSFGQSLQQSVRLASEQVNAAGGVFDGRPLEVVFVDTESDPDRAGALAQKLVDEGVSAIVGADTSGQSGEVLAVAQDAQIPMVSCCATSTELSAQNAASSGFFFRTAPSDALQGKAQAYLALNGKSGGGIEIPACPEVAFFSRPDAYGDGFRDVFVAAYEGEAVATGGTGAIVAQGTFPVRDADPNAAEIAAAAADFVTDITQDVDTAGANPPLCVVFITFGAEGAALVGHVEDGLQAFIAANPAMTLPYVYLTGDGAQEAAFLQEIANQPAAILTKLVGTVPYHAESAAYDQFATAYRARHGVDATAYTAQAFDAMFITALAITSATSTKGADVRNALFAVSGREGGGVRFEEGNFFGEIAAHLLDGDKIDYVGPSGELTFDAFGDVQGDYMIWRVEDLAGTLSFADKVRLPVDEFDPR